MSYVGVLVFAAIFGAIIAGVMFLLTDMELAEKYPVGGILASGFTWVNFGLPSALITVGMLVIGGTFGYYLATSTIKNHFTKISDEKTEMPGSTSKSGVSMADYI